jgi:hypothetical protein
MTPRPLAHWEAPQPGDLVFETGTAWTSRIIQLGTGDDLNHVAIVTGPNWHVVEAVGRGVVEHNRPAPHGYVVRVTDDPRTAISIVNAARAISRRGVAYSWATIAWHVGTSLAAIPGFRRLGRFIAQRASQVETSSAMVCSEVALDALRIAALTDATLARVLEPLDGTPSYQVSPARLFRLLCNRQDWPESTLSNPTPGTYLTR